VGQPPVGLGGGAGMGPGLKGGAEPVRFEVEVRAGQVAEFQKSQPLWPAASVVHPAVTGGGRAVGGGRQDMEV